MAGPTTDTTTKTGPITAGVNVCFGRVIAAISQNTCLYAGIKISGSNAEFMPRQWKISNWVSLGVTTGGCLATCCIKLFGISTSLSSLLPSSSPTGTDPIATLTTQREPPESRHRCGMKYIYNMMKKLGPKHGLKISVYGNHNSNRQTGHDEISSCEFFNFLLRCCE